MFEIPRLFGTPARSIPLSTRKHRSIENQQEVAPDDRDTTKWRKLLDDHPRWQVRKGPEGIYNCFGHVWASRRTAIFDDVAIAMALADDFCRVASAQEVSVGDLALYLDDDGGALHIGEIVEFRSVLVQGPSQEPWVLSKLNSTMGEVRHALHDVPFKDHFEYRVVFVTERPNAKGECRGITRLDV